MSKHSPTFAAHICRYPRVRERFRPLAVMKTPVPGRRMILSEPSAPTEKLLAKRARRVVALKSSSALQFRHKITCDVRKGLVGDGVCQVEAVDVRFLDPFLNKVSDRRWAAHKQRAKATNADPFREIPDSLQPSTFDGGIRREPGLN